MWLVNWLKEIWRVITEISMSVQAKYFWIAIIIVGSIGVWLPYLLSLALNKPISVDSIPISLTTYYVTIYFAGCVDSILKQVDELDSVHRTKSKIMNVIGLILLSIGLIVTTVWMNINGYLAIPIVLSIIGGIIALRLWWLNNMDNPNFAEELRAEAESKHGRGWQNG